jgi:hypothetical protein
MADWSLVTEEVGRLYDNQSYQAAHDLIWAASKETTPGIQGIFYLSRSLSSQETQELVELARKYRDSFEVQKSVAEALISRNQWWVIETCTELLRVEGLSERDELDIRWARLRATVQQRKGGHPYAYERFPEDFSALWGAGDAKIGLFQPYSRKAMLAAIAQIHHSPAAIPALQKVIEMSGLVGPVQDFLGLKLSELIALEGAWRVVEPPRMDTTTAR